MSLIINKYFNLLSSLANPSRLITFLLLMLSNLAFAAETQNSNNDIIIGSELNPPFVYMNEQGNMVGTLVDKLDSILRPTNLHYKFNYIPWKRGLEEINKKRNLFIFPMTRTTEREHLYKWLVPLHTINYGLYGLNSKLSSLTIDVSSGNFTVSCVAKTVMCNIAKEFGFPDSSIIVMSSASINHGIKLVLRERVDFIILSKEGINYFRSTLDNPKSKLIKINNYKYKAVEYLVGSHKTDDTLIKKIRDSVKHQEQSN